MATTRVAYKTLDTPLTSRNAVGALDIDWSLGGLFTKTISGNSTFTFSNLQLNKVVVLVLTGNFTVTLPAYCRVISGTYDGTVDNYIQFHCTNATASSEEVWVSISQEA